MDEIFQQLSCQWNEINSEAEFQSVFGCRRALRILEEQGNKIQIFISSYSNNEEDFKLAELVINYQKAEYSSEVIEAEMKQA